MNITIDVINMNITIDIINMNITINDEYENDNRYY